MTTLSARTAKPPEESRSTPQSFASHHHSDKDTYHNLDDNKLQQQSSSSMICFSTFLVNGGDEEDNSCTALVVDGGNNRGGRDIGAATGSASTISLPLGVHSWGWQPIFLVKGTTVAATTTAREGTKSCLLRTPPTSTPPLPHLPTRDPRAL